MLESGTNESPIGVGPHRIYLWNIQQQSRFNHQFFLQKAWDVPAHVPLAWVRGYLPPVFNPV